MTWLGREYRHVHLIASRNQWSAAAGRYDPRRDLVLTLDFGLRREIEQAGGRAEYLDRLGEQAAMQENNFLAGAFFRTWHHDASGRDIFTARSIPFGFAFRIEMWSEFLGYVRLRASLEQLRGCRYETLFLAEGGASIGHVLADMGLPFSTVPVPLARRQPVYYFDVDKYMRDALHGTSLRAVARDALLAVLARASAWGDRLARWRHRLTVFVQVYHPTRRIIERMQQDPRLRVVTATPSGGGGLRRYLFQRLIPLRASTARCRREAESLLDDFRRRRSATLRLSDGTDVTAGVYAIIERQIAPVVAEALRMLDSVLHYVRRSPIQVEVMIANLGLLQTIVDCVLRTQGVPRYLIVNGLMTGRFCDEARYATVINGYSESIKRHYYDGAPNVVCLGDPRMDDYVARGRSAPINRATPTVSIGTSGFNNIDLNSHVAVEFDFMFDVLSAFQQLRQGGVAFKLIIKVRPNGVLEQYTAFAAEYFPGLDVEVVRLVPMREVLQRTDLYISIYSQTMFEASCLGIPVIYYKKDREILDPPFDQRSEVVTVDTVAALTQAFRDFQSGDARFDAFLERPVMERYVGPLDGGNLERNLQAIYALLDGVPPPPASANH